MPSWCRNNGNFGRIGVWTDSLLLRRSRPFHAQQFMVFMAWCLGVNLWICVSLLFCLFKFDIGSKLCSESSMYIIKQKCIPVGCVLPPPHHHTCTPPCHAHTPATHAPPPPPRMPSAMHTPCHTCPKPCIPTLPCMPPPYTPSSPHTCPLPTHRILKTGLWKHYLPATTVAGGNKITAKDLHNL